MSKLPLKEQHMNITLLRLKTNFIGAKGLLALRKQESLIMVK